MMRIAKAIHATTKAIRALCLLALLMWCVNAFALSLGKPNVESLINQTLDIKVPISDVKDIKSLRLLPHDSQLYTKAEVQYTPLQERFLLELVTTAGKPYIAVSSIGAVGSKSFGLVIGIADAQSEKIAKYLIKLSAPAPAKSTQKQLSSAEVLLRLINSIVSATGLSQAEVLGQLLQIVRDNETSVYPKRAIFKLSGEEINSDFINGLKALMNNAQRQQLDAALKQSTPALAVSKLLFEDKQHKLLQKLLRYPQMRSFKDSGSVNDRMAFMKERVTILENQVMQLQQMLQEKDATPEPKPKLPGKFMQFLKDPLNPNYLLMRPFWVLLMGAFIVLLLLLLWLRQRKVNAKRKQQARQNSMLPGQRELEKELGLSDKPASDTDDAKLNSAEDEIESKINLANMYLEMKDYESAHQELDEVIAKGNSAQIKRAKKIKAKLDQSSAGESEDRQ